ncbi:MAG TPA: hypothetical protein DCS75_05430 [Gemmatimonadetes bacterium]|nr:hypothetical protein [Gemmatimonadota bacterium]HAT37912.1 hypothetical protein [Gemmatimonadota bacterium]HBV06742.1 hypothetical protein [Gemmatimonadota bacterium]HCO13021.1 hypothetical protein [Gemmatimonadota bacterium]|tara:strand:- start:1757 stop:2425 length:669 start_codon:yes stop_codon:yes gene_type:complete
MNRPLRSILKLVFLLLVTGGALAAPSDAQVPVILVPGWLDSASDLQVIRTRLLQAGWADDRVGTISFSDPVGSNREHAVELGLAVAAMLERTGSKKVDVLAHSMGGLAARWYILTQPDHSIRRAVFLGTPHRGTLSAYLAFGKSGPEMLPGSNFLDSLNTLQPTPLGVEPRTIRTLIDTHIIPGWSATLPGVEDHRVCCTTHTGLLKDVRVFELILSFLGSV